MGKSIRYRIRETRRNNKIGWRGYFMIGFLILCGFIYIPMYLEQLDHDQNTPNRFNFYIDERTYNLANGESIPLNYKQAVFNAYEKWERANPEYEFVQVDKEFAPYTTQIRWEDDLEIYGFDHEIKGLAQGEGRIILDFSKCKNSQSSMERIVLHEIGHTLGINHHSDPNHLMYGIEESYNYDQGKWNLPKAEKWNCRG